MTLRSEAGSTAPPSLPPAISAWPAEFDFEVLFEKLQSLFSLEFRANPFRDIQTRICIACTPRTGSNFLCETLQTHGALVGEYLRFGRMRNFVFQHECDSLQGYCEDMVSRYARRGVFGVKGATNIILPLLLSGEWPGFVSTWKFVFLSRDDALKQAISYFIAQKTGAFRSTGAARELSDEDYDADRIEALVTRRRDGNRRWETAFQSLGVQPYRLTYEQLASDPDLASAKLAQFLGLNGPPIPERKSREAALKKQANSRNAQWEARFREERAGFCAQMLGPAV